MMYLILITVFLTAILRLKAEGVKPATRTGILLLLVLCAAAVPVGGPALAEQAGPEIPAPEFSQASGFYSFRRKGFRCITPGTGVSRMRRIRCIPGHWK